MAESIKPSIEELKKAILGLFDKKPDYIHHKELIERAFRRARTVSDFLETMGNEMRHIYTILGDELLDVLRGSLKPEVWERGNFLFNPSVIPADSDEELFVISDGTTPCVQDANRKVNYYGDVKLDITHGFATVFKTPHTVMASGDATVAAQSHTHVIARENAKAYAHNYSRVEAFDYADVYAGTHSFVESKGVRTTICLGRAGECLISSGSAQLEIKEHSRAVILADKPLEQPIELTMESNSLVYSNTPYADNIQVKEIQRAATLISGHQLSLTKEEAMDMFIPHYKPTNASRKEPLFALLSIKEQREAILSFYQRPEDKEIRKAIQKARDEYSLLELIREDIPNLVDKGLTGDFLRTHFSADGLHCNYIFTKYNSIIEYPHMSDSKSAYFFGDLMGHSSWYGGKIYGYENALVISESETNHVEVGQNANAIATNYASVHAKGQSSVLGLFESKVELKENSSARMEQNSYCMAYDHSHVKVYGEAGASGFDHATVEYHDESYGALKGNARALATTNGKIHAAEKAEIAFATYDTPYRPEIMVEAKETTLIGLDSPERLEAYRASLYNEKTEKQKKSSGLKR